MESASFALILFGFAAALLSNLSRAPHWRFGVLLAASMVFIASLGASPVQFLPFAGFLLLGFALTSLARFGPLWRRASFIAAIITAFAWLKQYSFFPSEILLPEPYLTLGLSYVFFRVLHLIIEAGAGGSSRPIGPVAFLGYTLNFTTFVSGPIQRYPDFAAQFTDDPADLDVTTVLTQLERIVRGFFKVNVLGMLFSMVQSDALMELGQDLPIETRLLAAARLMAAYPFFLYCNFSGYIDIVMALARLSRIRLPENFNRPFSATSFIDFWSRWHITLSSWLKDYVYNPLLIALMRRDRTGLGEPYFAVFAFFVTFFLVGIWHGRTSEFVMFGALQGGGVALNKFWQIGMVKRLGRKEYRAVAAKPLATAFGRGLTFTWFSLTLFWFWGSWTQLVMIYRAVGAGWVGVVIGFFLVSTAGLSLWEAIHTRLRGTALIEHRYARVGYASALALASFIVVVILSQPAPGVVYRTF